MRCFWLAAAIGGSSAFAQTPEYPVKPVRFIAGFPAGGPSDIVTRAVAKRMSELLGQPVVVENRSGAGGHIAVEALAKSPPDGYTILLGGSFLTIGPSLYKKLAYDPVRDIAPIGLIAHNQYLLVVHPAVPARSAKELIALTKSRPGQLNYGSSGVGAPPHLATELMLSMAHVDAVHVPYKGATPAITDLVGGHIDFYVGGISGLIPQVRSGRLRGLAVTSPRRHPSVPELPTVSDTVPRFESRSWIGVLMPAGTPKDIVARVNSAIVSIVNMPEVRQALIARGADPETNTPDAFAKFIRDEVARAARVVKAAGIKPQ
ncbi:MAG: tripartite tricarboxylate transporter substrate binding protein [Betaproteobacteria bacterium]|nr:tripartite tricarboxylate transporter substrate binding protein [Betaproteobacteria bacterium]